MDKKTKTMLRCPKTPEKLWNKEYDERTRLSRNFRAGRMKSKRPAAAICWHCRRPGTTRTGVCRCAGCGACGLLALAIPGDVANFSKGFVEVKHKPLGFKTPLSASKEQNWARRHLRSVHTQVSNLTMSSHKPARPNPYVYD